MAGLSRSKNLAEKGLNLKSALQKLYAPGIEKDLELFSLSSKITSTIISGPKIPQAGEPSSQVYGLESQKIKVKLGTNFTVFDRTKFLTNFYTFTEGNIVYFTKFSVLDLSAQSNPPRFSDQGSIADARVTYGGRGYYLVNSNGTPYLPDAGPEQFTLRNVVLLGKDSLAETARATVTFTKELAPAIDLVPLYHKFTPNSTDRYVVTKLIITTNGKNYLPGELLRLKEDILYAIGNNSSPTVILKKQSASPFVFTDPIIKNSKYYYRVVNADSSGFFLYDEKQSKYVFLDKNTTSLSVQDFEIRRDDRITVENLLQFKFAGSPIYLSSYGAKYQLDGSIAAAIGFLGDRVDRLYASALTTVQNTKIPTPADSDSNELGYSYNSFVGKDVDIWQRVVMRDQDYLLDPGAPGSRTELTGDKLRSDVDNFKLSLTPVVVSVTNFIGNNSTTVEATVEDTEPYQEGDIISIADATGTQQVKLNGSWKILSILSSTKFEFLCSQSIAEGTYTTGLGTTTITPTLRTPGIFIKVGQEYFRAFSTTDKPFLEQTDAVVSNPNLSISRDKTDVGALSAENQIDNAWYSYNTQIAQFAQRISYDSVEPDDKLKSKNGAFCIYRNIPPRVLRLTVKRGTNQAGSIYSVPLFTAG